MEKLKLFNQSDNGGGSPPLFFHSLLKYSSVLGLPDKRATHKPLTLQEKSTYLEINGFSMGAGVCDVALG